MSYNIPNSFQRVRLNTLSEKNILSPLYKTRKLFETNSSKVINIKESKNFVSPFEIENLQEENDEEEINEEEFFYKKHNFEKDDDIIEIYKYRKNKSFCEDKIDKGIKIEEGLKRRNNSLKDKNIDDFCFKI